jgi:BirA family biotin operon repressor/biotin-[acetyl-CoA-carboxylase] ligase
LEAPRDAQAIRVVSLRVGLALSRALEAHATHAISLKWPNDLMQGGRGGKLGGILVETRWRADIVDWVAIGVGINLRVPGIAGAAAMVATSDRLTLLAAAVGAVRAAVAREGPLSRDELRSFASRDWLAGRRVVAPACGVVAGIDALGALVIEGPDGPTSHVGGSPVLEEDEHVAGV